MQTLYCDINNGLMESGDDDYVTEVINDEKLFIDAVKTLSDHDYIVCRKVSKKTYDFLKDEYGIH